MHLMSLASLHQAKKQLCSSPRVLVITVTGPTTEWNNGPSRKRVLGMVHIIFSRTFIAVRCYYVGFSQ